MEKITFNLIALDWEKDNSLSESIQGVYQIYGDSPIYGLNSLLYIGQSNDIEKRWQDHLKSSWHIKVQPNLNFFFAKVEGTKELVDMIEKTLICLHKPSLNSQFITGLVPHQQPIYIQNRGKRGVLPIECTNYYYLNDAAKE